MSTVIALTDPGVNFVFKNMNNQLVDGYKRQGIVPTIHEHMKNFEQTYDVKITITNGVWSLIEFPTEQDYVMAVMKWA